MKYVGRLVAIVALTLTAATAVGAQSLAPRGTRP